MAEVVVVESSSSLVSQHPKQQIPFNQQLPVRAEISDYPLSYWYGSDAEVDTDDDEEEEDTDDEEEDTDDEEEEEEWKQDLTKPYQYRRDITSVEEVLKEQAYYSNTGRLFSGMGSTTVTTQPPPEPLPLPPPPPPPPSPPPSLNVQQSLPLPPPPSPLSSLGLRELVKLLGQALAKLRDPSASGLESQTEALHPVSKIPRLVA